MSWDLIVVGAGAAGLSAARTARRRRADVAVVEAGPIGGECTFSGCIPSKTLIDAAARGVAFPVAQARVHDTVARVAATESATVLRREGIDVIEGHARLVGATGVRVDGRLLRAKRMVIAVGAGPLVPPIPGIGDVPVLTNDNVFEVADLPPSLLVVGGGPLSVELAQAFARFGASVTVIETADRLLPKEEPEASELVASALTADGVRVLTGRAVASAAPDGGGVRLVLDDGTVCEGSHVLVAAGRSPSTGGLGLEAAGVATDPRGYVVTDERLRTSVSGIWAAGDVAGRTASTHAADEMGRIAAGNALSRLPYRRFHDEWMPTVTFTDPEVARVGLTEAEAAGRGARVAYLPMAEVDRAVTSGRTDGYVKLVVGPRSGTRHLAGGRLLGAIVVAARAGEMIALPTLVLRTGMLPARLALTTQAYPTWTTAVQQAAAQLFIETGGRRARPAG